MHPVRDGPPVRMMVRRLAQGPFGTRSFRHQWSADLCTAWALEMETLILGWYVLVESASVVQLTIFGALMYGGTLLSPALGTVGDRLGLRRVLAAMRASYALLAGVIFHGYFYGEEFKEFWKGALFLLPSNEILEAHEHVPLLVKWSSFIAMVLGLLVAWLFYIRSPWMPSYFANQQRGLYQFLLNKWYFDELYDFLFVRPAKWLGYTLWKKGDGTVIDGFGPDGVSAWVVDVTNRVVKLQTGYLYHYAFVMLIGVAALVTWMML